MQTFFEQGPDAVASFIATLTDIGVLCMKDPEARMCLRNLCMECFDNQAKGGQRMIAIQPGDLLAFLDATEE